jgi:hypothetical protein
MNSLSLRLPESLHRQIRALARREGVSINQFLATAAAGKVAALMTEEYPETRAKRGSRKKFRAALAKVPDSAPAPDDAL